MQISMWILAEWLKRYQPTLKIEKGSRILQNVRLFSDELKLSRSTVYLSHIDSETILCANNNDLIILHHRDINEIFNSILDAFEYYNEWDNRLHDRLHANSTAKELLQIANEVIHGFLLFADATFFLREYYGDVSTFSQNPVFTDTLKQKFLPLNSLLHINQSKTIRMPDVQSYFVDIPDLKERPLVTNLFSNGLHQGWFIVCHDDNQFSQADRDLQDAFAHVLSLWLDLHDTNQERLIKSGIILEVLNGQSTDCHKTEERLAAFRWKKDDPKQLYVIRQKNTETNPIYAIDNYLNLISEHGFVLHYHDDILFLVNLALINPLETEHNMKNLLSSCHCIAGKSPVFQNIMDIASYYEAAKIASSYPSEEVFVDFQTITLDYALQTLKNQTVLDISHPALNILESYDKAHNTAFSETLFIYLQNACNYADTAKALYIHRSTLLYRLDKIQKLTGIDFQDSTTRFHLELSYRLKREGETF